MRTLFKDQIAWSSHNAFNTARICLLNLLTTELLVSIVTVTAKLQHRIPSHGKRSRRYSTWLVCKGVCIDSEQHGHHMARSVSASHILNTRRSAIEGPLFQP